MASKKVLTLVVTALALTSAIRADMGASCHLRMSDSGATAKLTARAGTSPAAFERFSPTALLSLLKVSGLSFSSYQPSSDKSECPRMKAEQLWREWRSRNPNTPSRYAGKNKMASGRMSVTLSLNTDDDMEPDPGFGKCGCDPATALAPNGCGWIHENIWQ